MEKFVDNMYDAITLGMEKEFPERDRSVQHSSGVPLCAQYTISSMAMQYFCNI